MLKLLFCALALLLPASVSAGASPLGSAISSLEERLQKLETEVALSEEKHKHNCTGCPRSVCNWPDYVCPPGSKSCAAVQAAYEGNYCLNFTDFYGDTPYFQRQILGQGQRSKAPEVGYPGGASHVPDFIIEEATVTATSIGNQYSNNLAPYQSTGDKSYLAAQNMAWWVGLANGNTVHGEDGWWRASVMHVLWNDALLPNCNGIQNPAFIDPGAVEGEFGSYNIEGCPPCGTPDDTCFSMNEQGGHYWYQLGTLEFQTMSPPYIPSSNHPFYQEFGFGGATGVYSKWILGRGFLWTPSNQLELYVYEMCPTKTAKRSFPGPFPDPNQAT